MSSIINIEKPSTKSFAAISKAEGDLLIGSCSDARHAFVINYGIMHTEPETGPKPNFQ